MQCPWYYQNLKKTKKQISFSMVQKGRRGEDYADFVQKQEWIDQEITV